jgi:phosphoribosylamine--glycine ligase
LLEVLWAAATGSAVEAEPEPSVGDRAAVTVVLAAADYPERADVGSRIDGVGDAEALGVLVFHAGTAVRDGRLVTNGGRVLDVTAEGGSIAEARRRAYEAAAAISFPGMRLRHDIAERAAREDQRVRG